MDYKKIICDTLRNFIVNAEKMQQFQQRLKKSSRLPQKTERDETLCRVFGCYPYATPGELRALLASEAKIEALELLTRTGVISFLAKEEARAKEDDCLVLPTSNEGLVQDIFISILDGIFNPHITERAYRYLVREQMKAATSAPKQIRQR